MQDPALVSIAPTMLLAMEAFGAPADRARDCVARIFGLRGEDSLRPWLEGETNDVEELARRDYEPDAGAGWRAIWERQLEGSFTVLSGQIADDWKRRLSTNMRQGDTTLCRQSTNPMDGNLEGSRHEA